MRNVLHMMVQQYVEDDHNMVLIEASTVDLENVALYAVM